jgi:hypothetical protein
MTEPFEDRETLEATTPDLRHAGAVVDQAIDYMTKQNIDAVAIASALLGGALGMLTAHMTSEGVLAVLDNAKASVASGELEGMGSANVPHGHA